MLIRLFRTLVSSHLRLTSPHSRFTASQSSDPSVLQSKIQALLKSSFPNATEIVVQDISGGCGAMFEVYVVSSDFAGVPRVKQHLAVSKVLSEEIKDMHGIRIFTEVPKESSSS